jgi:hypothetical protein
LKVKVTGFNFTPEDKARLQRLTAQLGWNRTKLIRELLLRAVVQGPSVDVVLPVKGELERETFGVLD